MSSHPSLEAVRPAEFAVHRDAIEAAQQQGWCIRLGDRSDGIYVAERNERAGCQRHFDPDLSRLLSRVKPAEGHSSALRFSAAPHPHETKEND